MTELFNKPKRLPFRRKLRQDATKGERILWSRLRNNQLGEFKFRRQFSIGNFIVDFYCPRLRLIIEIDGLSHYSENAYEQDVKREQYLKSLGLVVKRYPSQDIFYKLDEVLNNIYLTCSEISEKKIVSV